MSPKGEDCYFFFTSTCTKGDICRFRHCEAAKGSKTVCKFWLQNRCLNNACKFRHTDIKNIRKEVECRWEKQPRGCRKQDCTFQHLKPWPVGQHPVCQAKTSEKWIKPDDVTPDKRMESSGRLCSADAERRPCRHVTRKHQGRRRRGHPVLPAKDDEIDFVIKALEELKLEDSVNTHLRRAESPVHMDFECSPVTHTSSNVRPNLKRRSELSYMNGEPSCKRAKIFNPGEMKTPFSRLLDQ